MAELGSPANVLIVGGGVAALETLMALRDLAGDRVGVTADDLFVDLYSLPVSTALEESSGKKRASLIILRRRFQHRPPLFHSGVHSSSAAQGEGEVHASADGSGVEAQGGAQ